MSDVTELAEQMAREASGFLDLLSPSQREKANLPFETEGERRHWYYTPNERRGLTVGEMTSVQRQRSLQLLATGMSVPAYNAAAAIMANEVILIRRENFLDRPYPGREGDWLFRDQTLYFVTIFGEPGGRDPWSWRFSGHHVSVQFTITEGFVAATPCFLGAHPAISPLPGGYVQRPLAAEEDFARELLDAMRPDQLSQALLAPVPPPDIMQQNRPHIEDNAFARSAGTMMEIGERPEDIAFRERLGITPEHIEKIRYTASPKGLPYDSLDAAQQASMQKLLRLYRDRLPEPLANQYAELLKDEKPNFAWSGQTQRGGIHYYRVQSDRILIEYDNAQDSGNHIHSVWRDIKADFGGDILAQHYAAAH